MNPRLFLPALLAGLCQPAFAFDYDLLIVACKNNSCQRIAEQTLSGSLAEKVGYSRDGLQLQIETLASRLNEVDTQISLRIQRGDSRAAATPPALEKLAQRLQVVVEPHTLKQGIFTSLSAFASEGTFYRIWARLAAR